MENIQVSQKEICDYIAENGFSIEDFSSEELAQIEEEVKTIKQGGAVLDGVMAFRDFLKV